MVLVTRVLDGLSGSLAAIGSLVLLVTMLHVSVDVIARFFFNMPLSGTIEISSFYYMIAVVFLPLAAVEGKNGHIAVEILAQKLGESAQRILIAFVSLLSSVFYALITWRSWVEAVEKAHVGEVYSGSLNLAIWPPRFLMPIGCGLITIVLLWKAFRLLSGDSAPLKTDNEHLGE